MKILTSIILLFVFVGCGAGQNACGPALEMGCNFLFGEGAKDGEEGKDGKDGQDGIDGEDGIDGQDGVDGKNGVDGQDGQSCYVSETSEGAEVTCGSNTVVIENGDDAVQSPYNISEIIDPCGDFPNHADEIIIKMYNGDLVVYFQDGGRRFLTVLEPGNYRTTDRQKCRFTITEDGEYEE